MPTINDRARSVEWMGHSHETACRAWRRTGRRKLGTDASARTGAALRVRNPVETRTQGKGPATTLGTATTTSGSSLGVDTDGASALRRRRTREPSPSHGTRPLRIRAVRITPGPARARQRGRRRAGPGRPKRDGQADRRDPGGHGRHERAGADARSWPTFSTCRWSTSGGTTPSPRCWRSFPRDVVREHMAMPIKLDDDGLQVAVSDQPSVSVRALLTQSTDHPIRFVLAPAVRHSVGHRQQLPGHRRRRPARRSLRGGRGNRKRKDEPARPRSSRTTHPSSRSSPASSPRPSATGRRTSTSSRRKTWSGCASGSTAH